MIHNEDKEPKVSRMWHELYVQKESDPFDYRTDKQFCEDIKLDYGTFTTWKYRYRPSIYREVEANRKNYKNELRTMGHKALTKKLDKDTNAIKLLFQLLGDFVEKTEVKTEQMTTADKIRRITALLDSTGKKQQEWASADAPVVNEEPGTNG